MCCRRNTQICSRGKTLWLFGLEEESPSFSQALSCHDEETLSPVEHRAIGRHAHLLPKLGFCCGVALLALVVGLVSGVFFTPHEPALQVSRLRLARMVPPAPGGRLGDLQLEFAATVTVSNPNFVTAAMDPGTLTVYYKDNVLGSSAVQAMEMGGHTAMSQNVTVLVSGVEEKLGQAMLEDIANRAGLLPTETRCELSGRVPLLRLPGKTLALQASLQSRCGIVSDVRQLPEFVERKCNGTSSSHFT